MGWIVDALWFNFLAGEGAHFVHQIIEYLWGPLSSFRLQPSCVLDTIILWVV